MIRPKTVMKASEPDSEAFQKAIRKQRKKFSHFVFTETAPAMTPCNFVNDALVTNNGLKDKNLSYVLFAHNPNVVGVEAGDECCVRGMKHCLHYHLFTCSAKARVEVKNIRKATDKVYVESHYYQHAVACPLTDYATLKMCETMHLMAHVGEAFKGLDKLLNIQRYTNIEILKKLAHWANSDPIWELQKQSQILALEQWIGVIDNGPFKHALQNVIAAMVRREGVVNYDQHGWILNFECGISPYQCVCEYCVSTSMDDYVFCSNYEETPNNAQTYRMPNEEPVVKETALPQALSKN